MINRVILVGRLVADPDLRKTQSGTSVASFRLAVERRKTKDGKQETDFFNITAWQKTADLICQYLRKGSLVGIDGRLQNRSYETQSGEKRYVTEVITETVQFLESKKDGENNTEETQNTPYDEFNQANDLHDDLPF